jgi:transcriptional regulator with XRE-family HTH domain
MGKTARERPERLAEKLKQIREGLGLSQNEILGRLGLEGKLSRTAISGYELGTSEPTLLTLLKYSRLVNVHMEVLVDDELDLPERMPATIKKRH